MQKRYSIFLDPSYDVFHENNIFNLKDKYYNRDNQLLPFYRIKEFFNSLNVQVNTADYLLKKEHVSETNYYFSFGSTTYKKLLKRKSVKFKAFFIMEPVILAPHLYKKLPELTRIFDEVYLHNTTGNGYSLKDVNQSKLKKIYWPMQYTGVISDLWENDNRLNKIVVINGNHNPKFRKPEFYSTRIKAMSSLSKHNIIDLFGKGWSKWYSKQSMWPTYWIYRKKLMKIYKGECISKYEVLSKYKYCLCFENTAMEGYISEKIFDCFYTGTIPLYLGDPTINKFIPKNCFIDVRNFSNWNDLHEHVRNIDDKQYFDMKKSAREFMENEGGQKYTNSLENIFNNINFEN